jgi:hypothetical protein
VVVVWIGLAFSVHPQHWEILGGSPHTVPHRRRRRRQGEQERSRLRAGVVLIGARRVAPDLCKAACLVVTIGDRLYKPIVAQ